MIKIKTHEQKVEGFYGSGIKEGVYEYNKLRPLDEGFLTFGYWKNNTKTFHQAGKNMVDFVIKNSGIKKADRILNVACGYGPETFIFYKRFKPKLIEGVDLTKVQVDYANSKAKALKLDKRIKFYYGDAVALNFPDNTFSYIIGIEGPANFNTRERFFNAASRVLKKNGELILADTIVGENFNNQNKLQEHIMNFAINSWVVPKSNWVTEEQYKEQMKKAGLNVVLFKKIGHNVFPGYAKDSFRIKTIKTRLASRGVLRTIGLTIISYLLGYLYKRGFIEYIYVKALK